LTISFRGSGLDSGALGPDTLEDEGGDEESYDHFHHTVAVAIEIDVDRGKSR
jgi:hypothetical protein